MDGCMYFSVCAQKKADSQTMADNLVNGGHVNDPSAEKGVSEKGGQPRAKWGHKVEFFLCASTQIISLYNLGLSPFLVYKSGGGEQQHVFGNFFRFTKLMKSTEIESIVFICRCLPHPLFSVALLLWCPSIFSGAGHWPVHRRKCDNCLEEALPHVPR